jgi:hypothetical protein
MTRKGSEVRVLYGPPKLPGESGEIALTFVAEGSLSTLCQRRSWWSVVVVRTAADDDLSEARLDRLARGIAQDLRTPPDAPGDGGDVEDVDTGGERRRASPVDGFGSACEPRFGRELSA